MKKIVLITLGCLALVLGGMGAVLPILPTTPFVLCAAGCFGASSPALYRRLANARYFGEYVRNYKQKTGISNRARWTGILFLWTTLGISAAFSNQPRTWIILGVVGVAVSVHILTLRRKRPEADSPGAEEDTEPTAGP